MNLKQMEYFVAIVNEGNISAAAKSLHISQPPLSAQMKLLEDELGVVLFERGSRSIFLTEAGKVFYEKALHILHLTTAVSDELQQMGQGLKGPLHLGMISSVQTPRLIRALSSFVSLHPEVTLRISEGNTLPWLPVLLLSTADGNLLSATAFLALPRITFVSMTMPGPA